MRGLCWLAAAGGLLSFELSGGVPDAEQLFARLAIPMRAPASAVGRP
jgi:hypothetical protein